MKTILAASVGLLLTAATAANAAEWSRDRDPGEAPRASERATQSDSPPANAPHSGVAERQSGGYGTGDRSGGYGNGYNNPGGAVVEQSGAGSYTRGAFTGFGTGGRGGVDANDSYRNNARGEAERMSRAQNDAAGGYRGGAGNDGSHGGAHQSGATNHGGYNGGYRDGGAYDGIYPGYRDHGGQDRHGDGGWHDDGYGSDYYGGGHWNGGYDDGHDFRGYRGRWDNHRYRSPWNYVYPHGHHSRSWSVGLFLPSVFYRPSYYVDYRPYGLEPPPYGFEWVRVDSDVLLVEIRTGRIVDILDGFYY